MKKKLTFRTGLETTNIEVLKLKESDEKQLNNNSGLSPEEQEMLKSSSKRRKTIKK